MMTASGTQTARSAAHRLPTGTAARQYGITQFSNPILNVLRCVEGFSKRREARRPTFIYENFIQRRRDALLRHT